jgi:hypothetical protein
MTDHKPDFDKIRNCYPKSYVWRKIDFPQGIWEKHHERIDEVAAKLEGFLAEFELQSHQANFFYFAIHFYHFQDVLKQFKPLHKYIEQPLEMLQALQFTMKHCVLQTSITMKDKKKNESVKIEQPLVIHTIFEALKALWIEHDTQIEQGIVHPEKVKNWELYIDMRIEEMEAKAKKKKGRPKRESQKKILMDVVQKYLQQYTSHKADEGIEVSNQQAGIIFKYMDALDAFSEKLSWGADNIKTSLKKYREELHSREQDRKQSVIDTPIDELLGQYKKEARAEKRKYRPIYIDKQQNTNQHPPAQQSGDQ